MSTQDASLKEGNYDDASVFYPERWLKGDAKEYHAFASIPFGFGARKCLGQNIAETMLSLLTIRVSRYSYCLKQITILLVFIENFIRLHILMF